MYFNIEINILDYYSFECEKVRLLVFINYWIEKCTVKHWKMHKYAFWRKGATVWNFKIKRDLEHM